MIDVVDDQQENTNASASPTDLRVEKTAAVINVYTRSLFLLAHSKNELMQWRGVRRLSVRLSVNFCANRFFSCANGRIATKLAHDGHQVNLRPGCAQVQGQRSRDTRTFLDSWNELLRH